MKCERGHSHELCWGFNRQRCMHDCLSVCHAGVCAERYAYHLLPTLAMPATIVIHVKAAHGTDVKRLIDKY